MKQRFPTLATLVLVLAVGAGLAGCSGPAGQQKNTAPPNVTVSYPAHRQVTDHEDFTGRTAAVDSVQVRARVSGYLEKIDFKEGADVKEGELLFEIDPRPYQATYNQAEAQVRLQEATLKYQAAVYKRNLQLAGNQAVSQEELQQSLSQRDTAQAQVKAAKANLEQARLNLGFTKVTAPISGRIGRKLVTRGNLVVADQTLLTSIVSLDPMYAYFDVDEPTVLQVRELAREGKLPYDRKKGVRSPVFLGLTTEKDFPHEGYVDFVNNEFNPSTATLQVRGVFANPRPSLGKRLLAPGLFVRVRLPIGPPYPALLVVQSAVAADQDLNYVYVLDGNNKVARREIELGTQHGAQVVVTKGLKLEDRVVINGLQHVRPGVVVNPRLVPMPDPRPLPQNAPPARGNGPQTAKQAKRSRAIPN